MFTTSPLRNDYFEVILNHQTMMQCVSYIKLQQAMYKSITRRPCISQLTGEGAHRGKLVSGEGKHKRIQNFCIQLHGRNRFKIQVYMAKVNAHFIPLDFSRGDSTATEAPDTVIHTTKEASGPCYSCLQKLVGFLLPPTTITNNRFLGISLSLQISLPYGSFRNPSFIDQ